MSTKKKATNKRSRKKIKTGRLPVAIKYDPNMRDCYRPQIIIEKEVLSLPAISSR